MNKKTPKKKIDNAIENLIVDNKTLTEAGRYMNPNLVKPNDRMKAVLRDEQNQATLINTQQQLNTEIAKKYKFKIDDMMMQMLTIVNASIYDFCHIDENGGLVPKPVDQVPTFLRIAVEEFATNVDKFGNVTVKIKLYNKIKIFELMAQYMGIGKDDKEGSPFARVVEDSRAKLFKLLEERNNQNLDNGVIES